MNNFEAHIDLGDGQTRYAGTAYTYARQGRAGTTFQYDASYISDSAAYALEPAMPLTSGAFAISQGLPRSFRDASPDRWGRRLIEKGLRRKWRKSSTPARAITEADYLLGTSDLTRQGALRFRQVGARDFEAIGAEVPKMLTLPKLLAASNKLCAEDSDSSDDFAAVKILLDAGTGSLGGARPKSSVVDEDEAGHTTLYLAKFPHPGDSWDVMRWEKIAFDLAARAGISIPENRLLQIDNASVLIARRFDRTNTGKRIGYLSAMTLLESEEGQMRDYLDIADALSGVSATASRDLAELWRRMLFSLAINNTDDHLRNHAVLRSGRAWQLSPMFDVNPDPFLQAQRATSIGGALTFEEGWAAVFDTREWYGLSEGEAAAIKARVMDALRQWSQIAKEHGAPKEELRLFAPVFERAQ